MTEVIYSRGGNPDLTMGQSQPRLVTLMSMAQEILVRLNSAAAGLGMTLPGRQLIYPSAVPADCEQVTVLIGGWQGQPAAEGLQVCQGFRWCAQIGILISRCTPGNPKPGYAPTAEQMLACAQLASDDAELLLAVVGGFGEIGADLQLATPEPEGGFQSVLLNVVLPAFGGLD
jgi:hypothetical protein